MGKTRRKFERGQSCTATACRDLHARLVTLASEPPETKTYANRRRSSSQVPGWALEVTGDGLDYPATSRPAA
jgi:hypothetical protein